MNIQGKYSNYNVNNIGNIAQQTQNTPIKQNGLSKDTFQNSLYAKAPKRANILQNATIPISSQYSSKQLLKAYSNPSYVKFLINTNQNLQQILEENGLNGKVYPNNISSITNTHLTATKAIALQLANEMNVSSADKQILEQACIFHDFGKILIPEEIINKPSSLTDEEKNIMDLHADLGYELLAQTGMNKRVLDLVKNHHMPQSANNDILGQILSVADIYSALREQRSYKQPLTERESLEILDQKAQNSEVSTEVVNTLKSIIVNSTAA